MEAWSGLKPTARHLRTFGSICYVHVPSAKRSKLDQKAEVGIFLGYSSMSKGYRIYNMQSQKVYVSRDVVIDESLHWNWDKGLAEKDKVFLQKTEGKSDSPQLSVLTSRMNSDKAVDSPSDLLFSRQNNCLRYMRNVIIQSWSLSLLLKQ